MRRRSVTGFLKILTVVLILSTAGCLGSETVLDLPGAEVREYEGKDLSSINDFRENSIKGPQYIDLDTYRLLIRGLVENPVEYDFDEILASYQSYRKIVTLNCVEGWSVTILWEGIRVKDLLTRVGVMSGAKAVVFHAYDGYTTSLAVDYLVKHDILMAYKMNDLLLPPERGAPFQLVAESKWGYKWIKWITEIELSDDLDYRGYWESRGYANSGSLDEGFWGS